MMDQTITREEYNTLAKSGRQPQTDRWPTTHNFHWWHSGSSGDSLLLHDVRGLLGSSTHDSVGWG